MAPIQSHGIVKQYSGDRAGFKSSSLMTMYLFTLFSSLLQFLNPPYPHLCWLQMLIIPAKITSHFKTEEWNL